MTGHLLLATVLVGSCAPKIPPGPVATEQAAAPPRLVEMHDDSFPNLYLQAVIAAGSAYDPVGQEGLAALTARAMVEGGAGDRDGKQVRDALYPTGNDLQLVVDREWVSLRLECHHDQAARCLEIFADVLLAPRFGEDEVARLRDEQLYAVGDGLISDEEALGHEVLDSWLFEGHPYGHPTAGRSGVLPLLDTAAVKRFYAEHYVRQSVVVGIAGAYTDAERHALTERLDALPAVPAPELVLQRPLPVEGRSLLAVETETEVTGFHLGHPLDVTRDHPDWPALFVAITAFGSHRQSFGRLFRTLRGDRGLNYGDYAYIEPYVQRGWTTMPEQGVLRRQPYFSLWVRPTSLANGPFALKLAVDELEELVEQGLTEQELDATRSYLLGHLPLEAVDPGRRLAYRLDAEVSGQPDVLELLPATLPGLTLEQVNTALRAHLRPADLDIVAVSGDAQTLVHELIEETSTPIVYNDMEPSEAQAARDADIAGKKLGLDAKKTRVVPAKGIFR